LITYPAKGRCAEGAILLLHPQAPCQWWASPSSTCGDRAQSPSPSQWHWRFDRPDRRLPHKGKPPEFRHDHHLPLRPRLR